MSGSLIVVDKEIVSSSVSSVTLTGISSTFDVYRLEFSNVYASADDDVQIRVTTGGTADSDSEYDIASKDLKTSAAFGNTSGTGLTQWDFSAGIGTSGQNSHNGNMYLFNFNNANEYSFITMENVTKRTDASDELFGFQGGGVHTVTEANDGIQFFITGGGTFDGGRFVLYGYKK